MFIASGKEETLSFLSFQFKYILKQRSYDTNHLIVVFSGFGSTTDFTYDFLGSLKNSCRSAVLWIKDDFFNNNFATYYMDTLGTDNLESAIIQFIRKVQEFIDIEYENCTLLGCSKGGASALYYGTKYDFKNLLVSAPTLLIGSSIRGIAPKGPLRQSVNFICGGEADKEKLGILDKRVINVIEKDNNYNKNIFLISSEADTRHSSQVKPFIGIFNKYNNFNYIESKSCLVRSHPDVTFFNAPLILGILNCLIFNMIPSFLNSITAGDLPNKKTKVTKQPVFDVKKIEFDNNSRFHPEGVFFLRGLECKEYSDLDYTLSLESGDNTSKLKLAKGNKPIISKDYYENSFVNYDKAYFCTPGYKGLDLSAVPSGIYRLSIEIKLRSGDNLKIPFKYKLEKLIISQNGEYEVSTVNNVLTLKKY